MQTKFFATNVFALFGSRKILTFLALVAVAFGAPPDQAPAVPADVVLKPTFMTGHDSFSGGTAFLCNVPDIDATFLLTAQHLFGPACGLERQLSWQEIPKTYIVVTALCINEPSHFVTSSKGIAVPGAHAMDATGYDKDLAAYQIDSGEKERRFASRQQDQEPARRCSCTPGSVANRNWKCFPHWFINPQIPSSSIFSTITKSPLRERAARLF